MKTVLNHLSGNVTFKLFLAACLLVQLPCYAQKIRNVDFEVEDNRVKIRYDIVGCSGDENYDIKVSLGKNGKITEIVHGISGDLMNVRCGTSNTIKWDVLADRNELSGRIYFVVAIKAKHPIEETKAWPRRSWKADKGYFGGSIGMFTPYENYALPFDIEQNGFFINTTVGYLPTQLLGICSSIYIYGTAVRDDFAVTSWINYGIMIGPLISIPFGNKIKWELRPQVGYSVSSSYFDHSLFPDSWDGARSGVAYNLGTGFRLNLGKRTCYMLNVEYFSASRKFEDYPLEPDIGTLGASLGVAFRFY